jgi:hypothetical protein
MPSFVRVISHSGPLTHATLRSIVMLCKRYTSIDCSENGAFLVDGHEQNGEASYDPCSLSDSGG